MKQRKTHRHTLKDQAGNMVTEMALTLTLVTMIFFLGAFMINYMLNTVQDTYKIEAATETAETYIVKDLHPIEDLLNETITQLEELSNGQ